MLIISDITERKSSEEELREARDQANYLAAKAEMANIAKSTFLANVSHELRTPLTTIIGFSDILEAEISGTLNEDQRGYITRIINNGKNLLQIINDILDISKIEAGKMELEFEDFHISYVLEEVRESMYPIAEKKKIKLDFVNEIKDHSIYADKLKFQQIMYNLLSNAIKFTPDNGEVSVMARKNGDKFRFSVSDTGIGIPAHKQEDVFSPFTQVDPSNKRKYGGTGLGLALVKQFVEMHEGKIWLESEIGKGSSFTFEIPVR